MSNNKSKKRVYSKPVVKKPVEKIEEQVEVVKEFIEEFPEFASEVQEEIVPAIDPEVFETKLFVEEEPENVIFSPPAPDELGEISELPLESDELKEKLEEVNTKIEEFQTIQVEPIIPEVEPELIYTLTKEQEEEGAKAIAEMVEGQILAELKALAPEKIHGEYFLTEKQAHDEVKALSPEPLKNKTLDTLSNAELRHFRRTGQMPR